MNYKIYVFRSNLGGFGALKFRGSLQVLGANFCFICLLLLMRNAENVSCLNLHSSIEETLSPTVCSHQISMLLCYPYSFQKQPGKLLKAFFSDKDTKPACNIASQIPILLKLSILPAFTPRQNKPECLTAFKSQILFVFKQYSNPRPQKTLFNWGMSGILSQMPSPWIVFRCCDHDARKGESALWERDAASFVGMLQRVSIHLQLHLCTLALQLLIP